MENYEIGNKDKQTVSSPKFLCLSDTIQNDFLIRSKFFFKILYFIGLGEVSRCSVTLEMKVTPLTSMFFQFTSQ